MTAEREAWVRWLKANPKPSDAANWSQQCAKGQSRRNASRWVKAPKAYGDAIEVARNSGRLDTNPATAKPGDWHFWDIGQYGHVAQDVDGGGKSVAMLGTTHLATTVVPYGGFQSVSGYSKATGALYLGHSRNYRGGTIKPLSDVLGKTERKVKPGIRATRREGPGTNFATTGTNLSAGRIATFVAWAYGQDDQPKRIWFKGKSGTWFAATSFTDAGTHNLADVNKDFVKPTEPAGPVTPVKPPVIPPAYKVLPFPRIRSGIRMSEGQKIHAGEEVRVGKYTLRISFTGYLYWMRGSRVANWHKGLHVGVGGYLGFVSGRLVVRNSKGVLILSRGAGLGATHLDIQSNGNIVERNAKGKAVAARWHLRHKL